MNAPEQTPAGPLYRKCQACGAVALLALACGLDDRAVNPGAWSRAVGFIDSAGITTSPLVVPDTVQADAPFTVTVSTFGSTGCIRPTQSQVHTIGSTVDITPFDSIWSATGSLPVCLPDWQSYPRPVQLQLSVVGSSVIRLHGRGFAHDLTLERTVIVRPVPPPR